MNTQQNQSVNYLAVGIACLAITAISQASTLVNCDFDAGYTAGATLNGQSGTSDVGFSGAYTSGFASTIQVVAASGGNNLTYTVAGGGTISSGANVAQYTFGTSAEHVVSIFNRSLTGVSGQSVFQRIVLMPVVDSNNTSTDFNFYLQNNSNPNGNFDLIKGTGIGQQGQSAAAAGIGNNFFSNQLATAGNLTVGAANLLVARFNWDAGTSSFNSVDFWLNPSYGSSGTAQASATYAGTGTTSMQKFGLAVANLSHLPGGPIIQYNVDSLAVGTTWNDVVPVPEPSTVALGLFGFTSILLWRKRRAARSH